MIGKDHTADTAHVEGTNTKVSSYTNETGTPLEHHTTTTGAGSDYTSGTGVGHSHLQGQNLHHNNQPVSSLTQTRPGNFTNEEQLSNEVGATPTLGTTAGAGLQPVFSETEVPAVHDPHSRHTGRHIGGGVTGAGIAGAGAYEAEEHLGHDSHPHTGAGHSTYGSHAYTGADVAGAGRPTGTGVAYAPEHGHHGGRTQGVTTGGAGVGVLGAGPYAGEKHLGHHDRAHNDRNVLDAPARAAGADQVFTPDQSRPHNIGLTLIGKETPLNDRDRRDY